MTSSLICLFLALCALGTFAIHPKSFVSKRLGDRPSPQAHMSTIDRIHEAMRSNANVKTLNAHKQRQQQLESVASIGSIPYVRKNDYNIATIKIGSPAQQIPLLFTIELKELWLVDNGNVKAGNGSAKTPVYDAKASTTFVNESKSYNDAWGYHRGYLANDVFELSDGLQPKLEFGVVQNVQYLPNQYGVSGFLGLAPEPNNPAGPLNQILAGVENKVFTIWNSKATGTDNVNRTSQGLLTFGAEDNVNCPQAYVYADRLGSDGNLTFAVESLSFGESVVEIANATISEDWAIKTNNSATLQFFVDVTGAQSHGYNYTFPKLDCSKVGSLPTVQLNLGNGQAALDINLNDYVYKYYDTCYLMVYRARWSNSPLEFGSRFIEGRCVSVDFDKKKIGFGVSTQ